MFQPQRPYAARTKHMAMENMLPWLLHTTAATVTREGDHLGVFQRSTSRTIKRPRQPFLPRQDGDSRLRWCLPILEHDVQYGDPLSAQQAVHPLAAGNGNFRRRLMPSIANDWKKCRRQAPTDRENDIRRLWTLKKRQPQSCKGKKSQKEFQHPGLRQSKAGDSLRHSTRG